MFESFLLNFLFILNTTISRHIFNILLIVIHIVINNDFDLNINKIWAAIHQSDNIRLCDVKILKKNIYIYIILPLYDSIKIPANIIPVIIVYTK